MELFSQKNSQWAGLPLGTSPYHMGPYGCLTTIHAQAFEIAGYEDLNPAIVVLDLNLADAYTVASYPAGAGLLLWNKVSAAFPQYHVHLNDSAQYRFVQVIASYPSGRFEHWVLNVRGDGGFYDPFDGTYGPLKANYRQTGLIRSADIDPNPNGQANGPVPLPPPPAPEFPKDVTVTALDGQGNPAGLNERDSASSKGVRKFSLDHGYVFVATGKVEGEEVTVGTVTSNIWLHTKNGWWVAAAGTNYNN